MVINLWASYCDPCLREMPGLVALSKDPALRGVQFLGVSRDIDKKPALAEIQRAAVPYPSLFDPDGEYQQQVRGLAPALLPVTLVRDRRGQLAALMLGPVDTRALKDTIISLLK